MPPQQQPNTSVTVNSNGYGGSAQTNTATTVDQQANHATTVQHTHVHKIEFPSFTMPSFVEHATNSVTDTTQAALSWCAYNKLNLAVASFVSLYGILVYHTTSLKTLLEKQNSWCMWKKGIELASLVTSSQSLLLEELYIDIYKKYGHLQNHQDCTLSSLFLQDIQQEQKALENYEYIATMCNKFYLKYFLPTQCTKQDIEEKKARLQFVTTLFLSWHAKNNSTVDTNFLLKK